jgi:long-chain fatty acid transport protein
MKSILSRSVLTLALLGANQVLAGGLWLNEYGDFAGGRASAGAQAGTDEASTILGNPASAGSLKGSQLFVSAGAFIPQVEFDIEQSIPFIGDEDGGQAGEIAPGASLAYIYDTGSDKWGLGLSLAGLSGAGLDYNDEWVGRYQVTDVSLLLMGLGVSVSYQFTDKFAIGVKPIFYYSTLDMKLRVPTSLITGRNDAKAELDGDDTGWGVMAGFTYEFSPSTRIGVMWQSEFSVKYDGDLKIKGGLPVSAKVNSDTELDMAQIVRAGLHHQLNDRWGVDFSVGWDDWSTLDSVFVSVDTGDGSGAALEKNWKDTYHYAAGFQYRLNDDWDLTSGIAYDTNPIDANDRTADLPVDRQVRYNAGARYKYSDTLMLGGYVNYTDLGNSRITGDFWTGKYSTNELYSFSLFMNWTL